MSSPENTAPSDIVMASEAEMAEVLRLVPQQKPFRFIDRILELSSEHIVSEYRFRPDEYFYSGHFPDVAVTPGVIMAESMAQTGLVALGIYLLRLENREEGVRALFTECAVEFGHAVFPDTHVTIKAKREYWRRNKLKVSVQMIRDDGVIVAHGAVAGIGVKKI